MDKIILCVGIQILIMCQYVGGKMRIGKKIHEIIKDYEFELTGANSMSYMEPFVGMAGVLRHVAGEGGRPSIIGCDYEECIISFWKGIQDGWEPTPITNEKFKETKINGDESDPMYAYIAFGCSFRGMKWVKFCEDGMGRAIRRIQKSNFKDTMKDVFFMNNRSYIDHIPSGALIYCDPPYSNSCFNYGAKNLLRFDSVLFWETMRKWSEENIVLISERNAPDDFKCIAEFPRMNGITKTVVIEKIFVYDI